MLGRSMANVMDEYVFALGSENSPRLRQLLEEVKPEDRPQGRSRRGRPDRHAQRLWPLPRPERALSVLQHRPAPDYHRPTDLPDRIDYVKLRKISLWISDLVVRLADDAEAPAWDDGGHLRTWMKHARSSSCCRESWMRPQSLSPDASSAA